MTAVRTGAEGGVTLFSTLRNHRDGRVLWRSIVVSYVMPVAVGIVVWSWGIRLGSLGELVAGLSLLAGFLFALVIFVFQLRIGLPSDPTRQTSVELPRLIDELFANVTYSVVIALTATALALVGLSTEPVDKHGEKIGLDPWLSGLTIAIVIHLFAMILTCLRRTSTAYRELKNYR